MVTHFWHRLSAVFCAMAAILWLAAGYFAVSAAASDGTLTVVCGTEDNDLTDMEWHLHRVGSIGSDGLIALEGAFAEYPILLDDMTASSLQDAASTLENYAVLDGIKPLQTATVQKDCTLTFRNLEAGWYLVSGERIFYDDNYYTPSPILVEMKPTADGTSIEPITMYAKFTLNHKTDNNQISYYVKKIWQYNGDDAQNQPSVIQIGLYCDGKFVRSVTLDKQNDWSYEWTAGIEEQWRVKELNVPKDYRVVYRSNDSQFVIVNAQRILANTGTTSTTTTTTTTGTTSTTSGTESQTTTATTSTTTKTSTTTTVTTQKTTTTTSSGKLPQTGQLWWPVPVCGAGGLVLFAAGWRLNKKK